MLILSSCSGSTETSSSGSTGNPGTNTNIVTSPSNNQKSVPTNLTSVSVIFSTDIDPSSVSISNLSISPGVSYSIDISNLAAQRTIQFMLQSSLSSDTVYTATLTSIRDTSGNTLPAQSWNFTTAFVNNPGDTTSPTAPGNIRTAAGSPTNTTVQLLWNASTDNQAVAGYRVLRNGSLVSTTTSTSYADTNLQPATNYQYSVIAFDAANNTATSSNLTVRTLSQSVDTTAPTVSSVTPANNATNVAPSLNQIVVNFDEPMNANTLNSSTFTLNNGLTGTVSAANSNTQAVFTPNTPLSRSSTYTATINGATDAAGNNLQGNNQQVYSWSFSTCGSTPSSTYTVSWDAVVDTDLTGYRIYYGKTFPLTKSNGTSIDLGNVTSWIMNPVSLGFLPCDTVYVAVTALGSTKTESALSGYTSEIID